MNYYFKYYELLDAVFLVSKKKPLTFLHVYHHAATAILVFVHLDGRITVSWIPATLNLGVHVLMYYYYYATAGGTKIWWKRHLTVMQIVQFIITVGGNLHQAVPAYQRIAYQFFLPHMGGCVSTTTSTIIGISGSYLFLFAQFFHTHYVQTAKSNDVRKSAIASTKGHGLFPEMFLLECFSGT